MSLIAGCRPEATSALTIESGAHDALLLCMRSLGEFGGNDVYGLCLRRIHKRASHHLIGLCKAYSLTATEDEVLHHMIRGQTVENIAQKSNTSRETVRTHVRRIYSKMRVSSREEMFSRLRPFWFAR